MPRGPTRGIEPRTPTAGRCQGGPPSGCQWRFCSGSCSGIGLGSGSGSGSGFGFRLGCGCGYGCPPWLYDLWAKANFFPPVRAPRPGRPGTRRSVGTVPFRNGERSWTALKHPRPVPGRMKAPSTSAWESGTQGRPALQRRGWVGPRRSRQAGGRHRTCSPVTASPSRQQVRRLLGGHRTCAAQEGCMSLGLARVWPREAAGVQVPSATSLATKFSLRARRFAAECLGINLVRQKSTRSPARTWSRDFRPA